MLQEDIQKGRSVFVCMTTRDGMPNNHADRAAERASRMVGAVYGYSEYGQSVDYARNSAVLHFLDNMPDCKYMMFVDSDTEIPNDAIERLLALDTDIATGCVPAVTPQGVPCITVANSYDAGRCEWHASWFNGVRDVPCCGAACLLIKRNVFETIGAPWFKTLKHYDIYAEDQGEDVWFCRQAINNGFVIKADGAVRCRHYKMMDIGLLIPEQIDLSLPEPAEAARDTVHA